MQVQWRPNPKTPDGLFKRGAIALLVGLAAFMLSLPIAFFLFLNHFQSAYPKDTQNLLSALTASVVLGLGLAAISATATLLIALLYKRLGVASHPAA